MRIGSANLVEKIDQYKVYILIAVPIVLFNWIAIFGVNVLVADDAAQYYGAIEYTTFRLKFIHRFIGHITHGLTFSMMALSPELIRAIYVFFVLVPLSCLFYHLYHKKMGIPGIAAYCAAVLPNILPGQIHIPAFVNGTHVSLGLLAVAACLLAGFRYLDNQDQKNWQWLLTAALLYLLATQITDQPVFSFPVLLFAFWGYHRLNKKHLFLAVSFFLVFLYKAASIILMPRGSSTISLPTFTVVVKRMRDYFLSALPLPEFLRKEGMILGIIVVFIVITGLVLHIKNRNEGFRLLKPLAHLSHKTYTFYIYGLLFIWLVSHIIAFIAMSPKGFRARYTYYSAYGLNALLILSLYPILKNIFHKKTKLISLIFIVIVLISGVSRFTELKAYYGKLNANQAKIIEHLNQFKFPEHSQIVLHLTNGANFWSNWYQSSGHLKFMLKRDDIDGLIGDKRRQYFNFYNPFDMEWRRFKETSWMRGINLKRPLFLFVETNKKFKQYQYALQWMEKAREPKWRIFHFDKQTGKASLVLTGKGIDEYHAALTNLENKGIRQKDILWGGPASIWDLRRLKSKKGNLYTGKNTFAVLNLSQAKQFFPPASSFIPGPINFGDAFQLVDVSFQPGYVGRKYIFLLWKSLKKQKIGPHQLLITFLMNQKDIWRTGVKFCQAGLALAPGDCILGSVALPAHKLKTTDFLGIGIMVSTVPKRIGLKIRGDHKTDQKGVRLLIPIRQKNGMNRRIKIQ